MGGVEVNGASAGHWFWSMLENDEARGIIAGGFIVLLSIPKALLGELLRAIPDPIMPPENIPAVMALVGLALGAFLGHVTPLPQDLAITVGIGAGWGAGTAHKDKRFDKLTHSGIRPPGGKK